MQFVTDKGDTIKLSKSIMVAHIYKQEFKKNIFAVLKPLFETENAEPPLEILDPCVVFPIFYAMAKAADRERFADYDDFINYFGEEPPQAVTVFEKCLLPYLSSLLPMNTAEIAVKNAEKPTEKEKTITTQ